MTVPQQTPVSNCWGNNSATEFSFDFYIAKESELLVEHTDLNGIKSTLENGVDYSIHEVGNKDGSYITFPLSGSKYKTLAWNTSTDQKELLTISLTLPIEQKAEYEDSGDLSKKNLELSFDYAIRLIQILNRTISRAVKVNEGDEVTPDQLIESLNESKRIAVDAASTATAQAENAQNSANIAGEKADIATAKTAEVTETYNNAMADIQKDWQDAVNAIEEKRTIAETSITDLQTIAESTISSGITDITTNKEQSMSAIDENRETSLAEIKSAKTNAVLSVNTTKENAVATVKQTGTDEYNKILSTGIDSKLGKNQITNCLTEVPQRIKYTLVDGTLTIKAGSVFPVPYGTKDLTSTYPKGATFLNNNFKVYDTQFTEDATNGNKFFVWAELVKDISHSGVSSNIGNALHIFSICMNDGVLSARLAASQHGSGDGSNIGSNDLYYNTTANSISEYLSDSVNKSNISYPLGLINKVSDSTGWSTVSQIFNGMGYIGSTVWVDKGVKGLIPDSRNKDGNLKNIEFTTGNISIIDATGSLFFGIKKEDNNFNAGIYGTQVYDEKSNTMIYNNTVYPWMICGNLLTSNNKITGFNPAQPFKAADENDLDGMWNKTAQHIINSSTNLTVGSSQYRDYDISSYLPNDGCAYEVLVEILGAPGAAANALAHYWVSDAVTSGQACSCGARAYSTVLAYFYGNGILPMHSRTLRLYWSASGSGTPTISVLRLAGYRKVR